MLSRCSWPEKGQQDMHVGQFPRHFPSSLRSFPSPYTSGLSDKGLAAASKGFSHAHINGRLR